MLEKWILWSTLNWIKQCLESNSVSFYSFKDGVSPVADAYLCVGIGIRASSSCLSCPGESDRPLLPTPWPQPPHWEPCWRSTWPPMHDSPAGCPSLHLNTNEKPEISEQVVTYRCVWGLMAEWAAHSQLVDVKVSFMKRFFMMHDTLASLEMLTVRWLVMLYRWVSASGATWVFTEPLGGSSVSLMSQ